MEAVEELVRRFSGLGHQGWVDSSLRGGQSWWEEILRQIADCDAFVAVVSCDLLNSVACQRELEWALALGKPVLPVVVEHLVQALPRELATRQIVDWTEPGADAAFALAGALMALPPAPAQPEVLPERPPAPLSYLTDLGEQVAQSEPLTHAEQHRIVTQLLPGLHSADREEQQGARYLLERFSCREDLYADVSHMLDLIDLAGRDTTQPIQRRAHLLATEVQDGPRSMPSRSEKASPLRAETTRSSPEEKPSPVGGRFAVGPRMKRLLPQTPARQPLMSILAITAALLLIGAVLFAVWRFWPWGPSSMYPVSAIVNVGNHPGGVAVDPTTHTVYATNLDDGTVSVIDGSTHDVVTNVEVGEFPADVAVNPGRATVYVAHNGTVSMIDGSTHKVVIPVRVEEIYPQGVAVDTVTATVYVAGLMLDAATKKEIGALVVIDGLTGVVTARVSVDSGLAGVAVDPGTQTVYATNYQAGTVSVIKVNASASPPTYEQTDRVEVGKNPDSVEVDPVTHTVYVTDNGGTTVSVIDGSTHKVTDTIEVGNHPDGVAVDPDTHKVYVVNQADNTVSVIDSSTQKVTDTVEVGKNPFDVAVDPVTHKVYVTNKDDKTVSVIEPR
jgi:YVTN family beta-propeller protein